MKDGRKGRGAGPGRIAGFLNTLAVLNGVLAVVLFAGLTLVVALQVFTRFVLHAPFIWSEELARFLFFWVVLLGSSLSVRQRRHFVIDINPGRSRSPGGRRRLLLDLIPDLCILAFSVLLFIQGIGYTEVGLLRVAPNSQINMALVYGAIPVFAALSVLYSLGHLLTDSAAYFREGDGEARPVANGEVSPGPGAN